jgi:hypothetical protein
MAERTHLSCNFPPLLVAFFAVIRIPHCRHHAGTSS